MKKFLSLLITAILLLPVISATVSAAGTQRQYSIIVHTSNITNAGTDAVVSVQIIGSKGYTEVIELDTSGYNDFYKGTAYTYTFTAQDVGTVQKFIFTSDRHSDDWHLGWIEFESTKYLYSNWVDYSRPAEIDINKQQYYFSSTFSAPGIWFIIGGGVVILAAAVFITIFVVRKKKAKLALSVAAPSDDNTEPPKV